jgi:hypothetical protein
MSWLPPHAVHVGRLMLNRNAIVSAPQCRNGSLQAAGHYDLFALSLLTWGMRPHAPVCGLSPSYLEAAPCPEAEGLQGLPRLGLVEGHKLPPAVPGSPPEDACAVLLTEGSYGVHVLGHLQAHSIQQGACSGQSQLCSTMCF